MMFKTHLFFALFLALLIFNYYNINLVFILILVLASILPDIDHSKSFIGRKLRPLSWLINFIFGHRKLIHSLFFVLILTLIIKMFSNYYLAFLIGYVSHLFLDLLTKQGLQIFYPLKFKVRGFIKTNGLIEKLFLWFLIVVNLIYVLRIFII